MGFFPHFWKRHPRTEDRKSVFGGVVKSQEEVEALNQKILAHEEKETKQAEKELEQAKKHLWEE